jgi:LacI family transcriptional regulator
MAGPTIKDVAQESGVSVVSVSRVINDHPRVKQSTRMRVEAAMVKLRYQPNAFAQRMRSESSGVIGFLMPDFTNGVNAIVAQQVEKAMREAGYTVMLACSDFKPATELQAINLFLRNRADGIILQASQETDEEVLAAIRNAQCPVVLVDRDMEVGADSVVSDHYHAMRLATRHLIELGHRDIALITAAQCMRPGRERLRAFRDEMTSQGHAPGEDRIFVDAQSSDYGYKVTRMLLASKPPTAIIAAGNQILYGVVAAMRDYGLSYPDDISLIGADHLSLATVLLPKVTVLDRNLIDLGETAANLLLERMSGAYDGEARQIRLPCDLIMHSSCGPVPTDGSND